MVCDFVGAEEDRCSGEARQGKARQGKIILAAEGCGRAAGEPVTRFERRLHA